MLDRNRPTLAAVAAAFLASLAGDLEPYVAALPVLSDATAQVGLTLAAMVVAGLVGAAAQHLGDRAPWAFDSHLAGVAYALRLDPDEHDDDERELLRKAGIGSVEDAKRIIGEID